MKQHTAGVKDVKHRTSGDQLSQRQYPGRANPPLGLRLAWKSRQLWCDGTWWKKNILFFSGEKNNCGFSGMGKRLKLFSFVKNFLHKKRSDNSWIAVDPFTNFAIMAVGILVSFNNRKKSYFPYHSPIFWMNLQICGQHDYPHLPPPSKK